MQGPLACSVRASSTHTRRRQWQSKRCGRNRRMRRWAPWRWQRGSTLRGSMLGRLGRAEGRPAGRVPACAVTRTAAAVLPSPRRAGGQRPQPACPDAPALEHVLHGSRAAPQPDLLPDHSLPGAAPRTGAGPCRAAGTPSRRVCAGAQVGRGQRAVAVRPLPLAHAPRGTSRADWQRPSLPAQQEAAGRPGGELPLPQAAGSRAGGNV